MIKKNIRLIIGIFILVLLCSCEKDKYKVTGNNEVLIYYACGYNNLSGYIKEDINDLTSGYLPSNLEGDNKLFIYSHLSVNPYNSTTQTQPTLTQVYKDPVTKKIVRDTLLTLPKTTISASGETLNEVLKFIRDNNPASKYGLILSSHATGWLPSGYYANPKDYDYLETSNNKPWSLDEGIGRNEQDGFGHPVAVPYVEPKYDNPNSPAVKSIGQDKVGSLSYEISIIDLAKAIPMDLEYILFDMCLMAGIEIAYELKDKCNYLGFSPTEILADGFNYKKLSKTLLYSKADPKQVCDDYYTYYAAKSGEAQSATITYIDCRKTKELAKLCSILFEKYRENLENIDYHKVQGYYRSDYHWFYDLRSILENTGVNPQDLTNLDQCLNNAIIYKNSTEKFLEIDIKSYSGLSMYLPARGSNYLNNFYKGLKWNIDTGLVK